MIHAWPEDARPFTRARGPGRRPDQSHHARPRALEDSWARGVVRRDTAMFRRLLDPRFVYNEDSTVMNAEQVIASIRDGDPVQRATN